MSLYDGPHNGLSPEALRRSPNLLTFLGNWHQPLTTASLAAIVTSADFAPALVELYTDDSMHLCGSRTDSCASKLMGYIVSCALDADATASVELSPSGRPPLAWAGQLGLCGSKATDHWPSQSCLEAVSACVLARVNALDRRVAISLRGEPAIAVPPLRDKVPLEKTLREKDGTALIASLNTPCCGKETPGDPTRNCGWDRRHVGRCAPGAPVILNTPGGAMVRVCKGIHGCDHSLVDPAPYAGLVTDVPSTATTVSFTCPSPPAPRRYYYFGVMVAAADPAAALPGSSLDVTPAALPPAAGYLYPAKEEEVFTYREGAFYGNIFKPPPPPAPRDGNGPPAEPPALFGDQYACYSSLWTDGVAVLTGRMCARSSTAGLCFDNYPYPCLNPPVTPPSPLPNSCVTETGGAKGSYLDCTGFMGAGPKPTPTPTPMWPRGLTVHLNDPCDLSSAQGCKFDP